MYKALMETTVVGLFAMGACGAAPAGPSQTNLTVTRLAPNIRMPLDSGIEKETLARREAEELAWLAAQIDVLPEKFRPFLTLRA